MYTYQVNTGTLCRIFRTIDDKNLSRVWKLKKTFLKWNPDQRITNENPSSIFEIGPATVKRRSAVWAFRKSIAGEHTEL